MHLGRLLLPILWLASFCPPVQGLEQLKFNVEGENPHDQDKYAGHVVVKEVSPNTATVQWTIGKAKEVTDGIAIKTDSAVGTAYGGKPLGLLSIFELKEDGIHALWTRPAKLEETGTFKLGGSDFTGKVAITGPSPASGHVTFTEEQPSVYKVLLELPDGRHEGIGIRHGKVLVAASGDIPSGIGVGAMVPKDEKFEGLWTTTLSNKPGTESWTNGRPIMGREIVFAGETYVLKENQSSPGKGTSQLREYLRDGDTWDGYSKMLALRLQHVDGDAQKLARATLEHVKQEHPKAFQKEIESGPEGTTIAFVLAGDNDSNVELNVWRYKDLPNGIASVQFVLRNKPPFSKQEAFTAEQDRNLNWWLADLKALAKDAGLLLEDTADMAVIPKDKKQAANAEGGDRAIPDALKTELDKCAEVAKQFVNHLRAQDTEKAVALMSDAAFSTISRADFVRKIAESNQVFGRMKAFNPDKNGTSFTINNGVMTFVLEADVEYENASVREALRFVRDEKDKGTFQFVGYSRKEKK